MKVGDKIRCITHLGYAGGDLILENKYYEVKETVKDHNDYETHYFVMDESGCNLYLQPDILKYFDHQKQSLNNKLKKIRLL